GAAPVQCLCRRARSPAFPSGPRSAPTPARTPASAPLRPRGRVLPSISPVLARGELLRRGGNHEGPCVTNRILVARGIGLVVRVSSGGFGLRPGGAHKERHHRRQNGTSDLPPAPCAACGDTRAFAWRL